VSRGQEPELERREADVLSPDGDGTGGEVDQDPAVVVELAHRGLLAGAPEHRVDARGELGLAERLADVVVGAAAQAADAVDLGVERGQHDHRHLRDLADQLERLPAVDPRHDHVEQDEVGARLVERAQPGPPVGRGDDEVARALQAVGDDRPLGLAVVDQEDLSAHQ